MIRKWQGEMLAKGFKPTYLKTIHNQLSAILNYAVNFYDLRSNPCRKAGSMGKSRADERPYWTLEEFQKFSDAIMDKQDSWVAFQILFWTGMCLGELLALQVKDVNYEEGTITVDESLARIDGEDLIMPPKTESSIRVITIHRELQEAIKEYIATLYRARAGTRLFAGRTKNFFEHEMERRIKLSGVKKITVHCTRHSHASMLVQMGFSPVEHVSLFSCDALRDVHAVSSETLEGRVPGAAPWLYADTAYAGKASNDKGINPVIFIQGIKGFFIPLYFPGVQAVHMGGESSRSFTCGKIVCNMYPVKPGGFHGDGQVLELMVLFRHTGNHGFGLFCPALCIWDGFHPDKAVLAEIYGGNNICTGTCVNPDKKR